MKRLTTLVLILSTTAIWTIWDLYMWLTPGKDDSISQVFLYFSVHPVLPFLMGMVMGHLFWPQVRD